MKRIKRSKNSKSAMSVIDSSRLSGRNECVIEIEVGLHGDLSDDMECRLLAAVENRFKRGRVFIKFAGESVRRGRVFSINFFPKSFLSIEDRKGLRDLLEVVVFQTVTKVTNDSAKVRTYGTIPK